MIALFSALRRQALPLMALFTVGGSLVAPVITEAAPGYRPVPSGYSAGQYAPRSRYDDRGQRPQYAPVRSRGSDYGLPQSGEDLSGQRYPDRQQFEQDPSLPDDAYDGYEVQPLPSRRVIPASRPENWDGGRRLPESYERIERRSNYRHDGRVNNADWIDQRQELEDVFDAVPPSYQRPLAAPAGRTRPVSRPNYDERNYAPDAGFDQPQPYNRSQPYPESEVEYLSAPSQPRAFPRQSAPQPSYPERSYPQQSFPEPNYREQSQPLPPQTPPSSRPRANNDRPDVQEVLTRRYQDPTLLRFAATLTPEQGVALYAEVLDYVTNRHLQPQPVQVLVQRGLYNLSQAGVNNTFVQANRLAMNAQQSQAWQQVLLQMSQQPGTTPQAAVTQMRQTMQHAQRFGVSPSVVALEFVQGAVESLDKYSAFLPEDAARASNQQLGDSMVGIGITIEKADAGIRILKTVPGSPAAEAGLKKDDILVSVDGQNLRGRVLDAATQMISGPEGSVAVLQIERAGQTASLSITRRRMELRSVTEVQMIDPANRIGYMKLESFASSSAREMEGALQSLHQQGMRGVVLDLRGDPGGLLTTSIEVADMFLPQGTIVSTRGRTASDDSNAVAKQPRTWKTPMVVLMDEDSASASEIFAAAIQENGRGLIVGRHSYGKGTVQTLFPLKSVAASVRLTTAKFYSPQGREMAGAGVEPDIQSAGGTDANGRELDIVAGVNALQRQLAGNR